MEVYLVRHTIPDVEKGICYGQTDLCLKDSFENECQLLLQRIPPDPDIIYSSPLIRCRELAKKFDQNKVVYDPRIMELNFGEWEMKKWDDIDEKELGLWMEDFVNVRTPDGESMQMMSDRVTSFWDDLRKQKYQSVAVITHGGVIRVILTLIQRLPLRKAFNFEVEYGKVVKVKIES